MQLVNTNIQKVSEIVGMLMLERFIITVPHPQLAAATKANTVPIGWPDTLENSLDKSKSAPLSASKMPIKARLLIRSRK